MKSIDLSNSWLLRRRHHNLGGQGLVSLVVRIVVQNLVVGALTFRAGLLPTTFFALRVARLQASEARLGAGDLVPAGVEGHIGQRGTLEGRVAGLAAEHTWGLGRFGLRSGLLLLLRRRFSSLRSLLCLVLLFLFSLGSMLLS